jgi:hypothetical protein
MWWSMPRPISSLAGRNGRIDIEVRSRHLPQDWKAGARSMLFYIEARDSERNNLSLFVREEDLDRALMTFAAHHGIATQNETSLEVRNHLKGFLYRVFLVNETTTGVLPWDQPEGLERLEDSEAWGDD